MLFRSPIINTTLSCPLNCQGNGICDTTTGTCNCTSGFVGPDCSTDPTVIANDCYFQTSTCALCVAKPSCVWCSDTAAINCRTADKCNTSNAVTSCSSSEAAFDVGVCPDNCFSDAVPPHGQCLNNLCICTSNYTGINCNEAVSCTGPLCRISTGTAAAIGAGAIVGIIIAILACCFLVFFGGYRVLQRRGEKIKLHRNINYEEEMQENEAYEDTEASSEPEKSTGTQISTSAY